MRNFFSKIHLWLSIPAGLIITVVCLSGAVLVYDNELLELFYPERYFVKETGVSPIPLDKLVPVVNAQLDTASVGGVTVNKNPQRTYEFSLVNGRREKLFVNQYTGKVIAMQTMGNNPMMKVMQLHRWLLDSTRKVGKPIVGYSTLFLVIILISGFFLWLPRNRKLLKTRLKIQTKYGARRFWTDLHISGGFYSFLLLLILALTGLTFSFDWYRQGLYALFGVEMKSMMPPHAVKRGASANGGGHTKHHGANKSGSGKETNANREADFAQWQTVLTNLQQKRPDYKTINVQTGTASVVVAKFWGNSRESDNYDFDAATGAVTKFTPYSEQDKSMKLRGWIYTIHIGAWGGWFSKLITCLAALMGASLPLTGYYYWIKRKLKKKNKVSI